MPRKTISHNGRAVTLGLRLAPCPSFQPTIVFDCVVVVPPLVRPGARIPWQQQAGPIHLLLANLILGGLQLARTAALAHSASLTVQLRARKDERVAEVEKEEESHEQLQVAPLSQRRTLTQIEHFDED